MRFVPSHDVAKSFGKYQDEALAERAVGVLRYGRPTVVILSYAEYERLVAGRPGPAREVYQAGEMPEELVAGLEQALAETRRSLREEKAATSGADAPA